MEIDKGRNNPDYMSFEIRFHINAVTFIDITLLILLMQYNCTIKIIGTSYINTFKEQMFIMNMSVF